jgi:hypothetical protein
MGDLMQFLGIASYGKVPCSTGKASIIPPPFMGDVSIESREFKMV